MIMKIVNVGCGSTPIKNALNFDNSFTSVLANNSWLYWLAKKLGYTSQFTDQFVKNIKEYKIQRADATNLPLQRNTIDVIYSSHMIEHMGQDELALFLKKSFDALKSGGTIRLLTPDFRMKVDDYLKSGDADMFFISTLLGRDSSRGTLKQRIKLFFFGDRSHLFLYDAISLSKKLKSVGFSNIKVLKAGETTIPFETNIDYSERMDESLYIEAKKT